MLAHGGQTMVDPATASSSETDLQKYLKRTADEYSVDSPPEARYSPSISSNVDSYFNPPSLSRTESIFSFSRATFSSQITSLTSMNLSNPENLSASVSAIPTAPKAVRALGNAADQVQLWAAKAIKVLTNLDADDDVEWAAAAGREGLDETDKSVRKFETLVDVYVRAIDDLQKRPDIGLVEAADLQTVVDQMEATLADWNKVRDSLKNIHDQVELAMEWEELWGTVLGDVGEEMDGLSNLVFEMEEKRHNSMREDAQNDGGDGIDLNELESFLHEGQKKSKLPSTPRFSLPSGVMGSPLETPTFEKPHHDSNLMALFARMQPLRASLDFLPMRLSMFRSRADDIFPAACAELEERRGHLEDEWKKLEKDADTLRKELGEDRWILVFRNAGRQAQKMCESVERSISKLQEGIDSDMEHSNPSGLAKRVENFDAKRIHYGPAIDRVLAIIQKGVKDRVTVNGEILRLHADMTARIQAMHQSVKIMEAGLEEANSKHSNQLRDSISSIITMDRSISGSFGGTPGSSPASSVVMPAGQQATPPQKGVRSHRSSSTSRPPHNINRHSSGVQSLRPATPLSQRSVSTLPARTASPSPAITSVYRQGSYKPPTASVVRQTPPVSNNKPRWNSGGKSAETRPYGNRSVSTTHSSPLARPQQTLRSKTSVSFKPGSSPLSRDNAATPQLPKATAGRRTSHLQSFAERAAQASKTGGRNVSAPVPSSPTVGTIRSPSSLAVHSRSQPTMNRPPSALGQGHLPPRGLPMTDSGIDIDDDELDQQLERDLEEELDSSPSVRPKMTSGPGSGTGRRVSLLPIPKSRVSGGPTSGRESSLGNRPPWKG